MTPKHTNASCPTLPITADGGAFSFSFRQLRRRSTVSAIGANQAVAQEIHNMNAFNPSEEAGVHIMNFIVSDQKLSGEIHIMNFMNSKQVGRLSALRIPDGSGKAGAPSKYKGARNVMS
jgi:hypothetical protein